jgi:hypothetical protein
MLAETVDAVIGIDTHRDNHEVEIADAAGRPIATMRIETALRPHVSGLLSTTTAMPTDLPLPASRSPIDRRTERSL